MAQGRLEGSILSSRSRNTADLEKPISWLARNYVPGNHVVQDGYHAAFES